MRRRTDGAFTSPPIHMDRPKSLSIISWFLIVGGGISILGAFNGFIPVVRETWATAGIDPLVAGGMAFIGGCIQIFSGYAMLERLSWGRLLYSLFAPVSILAAWLLYADWVAPSLLPAVLLSGLILILLYRPPVNAYFEGRYREPETNRVLDAYRTAHATSGVRRFFGIVCLVLGGGLFFMALMTLGFAESWGVARIVLATFLAPCAVLLLIGTWSTGLLRWKAGLGWVASVSGGMVALYGLSIRLMSGAVYWDHVLSEMDASTRAFFEDALIEAVPRFGAIGCFVGTLGILLLVFQRQADLDAVTRPT